MTKIKRLILLRETLGIFLRALLTNNGEIYITSTPFFILGKNERKRTEILISDLDTLKQLDTMRKD